MGNEHVKPEASAIQTLGRGMSRPCHHTNEQQPLLRRIRSYRQSHARSQFELTCQR